MCEDISDLLEEWPYDPQDNVRQVAGDDGRKLLQIRTPLGIEQMEWDGRPDGGPDILQQFEQQLAEFQQEHGNTANFELSAEDVGFLAGEGILYYQRYMAFFQIGCYKETVRDTARNMRLFDFVLNYAKREEDTVMLEQYRPYILRIHSTARVFIHIENKEWEAAEEVLKEAIDKIELGQEVETAVYAFEKQRSLEIMERLQEDVLSRKPQESLEILRLREDLQREVASENFEQAAELRDAIRKLRKQ